MIRHATGLLIIVLLSLVACSEGGPQAAATGVGGYAYRVPEASDDGWSTVALADVGMQAAPLEALMADVLNRDDHHLHAILIVKDGKLVFEEYFSGHDADLTDYQFAPGPVRQFDRNTLHFLASASKSVTSLLLGIAIDRGFVRGVDDSMLSYFPGYGYTAASDEITLAHMLAMSTGLDWNEAGPYSSPSNLLNHLWHSPDPVRVVLEQRVVSAPGERFIYNSGTTNLLGEVVRRASGMPLREFAERYLFSPLGISDFEWVGFQHDPDMALASSALYLRPRDMAKIGQLMLQEGTWQGQQVVSAEWVRASVRNAISLPSSMRRSFHTAGYGYQWWLESYNSGRIKAYSARGHGLQFIVVLPDVGLVVVFTGGAWGISPETAPVQYDHVIEKVILPSIL